MAFDVQSFRASLLYDGARPSLFDISMTVPGSIAIGNVNQQITFRARAASLPGDSLSQITLNYFGREIKVAGTRTFPEWTMTVINDEDFVIRNTFERWMSAINQHVSNVRNPNFISGDGGYQADVYVTQYGKAGGGGGLGAVIKDYGLIGAFPTDVSPIELNWGDGDTVEEFTITFAYQWWETYAPNPTTDSASGNITVPGL
jgi:hypothetical protein